MAEGLHLVTDDDFEAEVAAGAVLVDFSADWCPPCKILGPIIEEVAKEVVGRAKVVSLDVSASPKTAARFNILNVPTMIFFKDGNEVTRLVGVTPKEKIIEEIDKIAG